MKDSGIIGTLSLTDIPRMNRSAILISHLKLDIFAEEMRFQADVLVTGLDVVCHIILTLAVGRRRTYF